MILQDFPLLDVRKPRILKDLAGWLTQLAGPAVWLWRSEAGLVAGWLADSAVWLADAWLWRSKYPTSQMTKNGHRTSNTDRFSVRFRTGLPGSFLCWLAELAGSLGLSHG